MSDLRHQGVHEPGPTFALVCLACASDEITRLRGELSDQRDKRLWAEEALQRVKAENTELWLTIGEKEAHPDVVASLTAERDEALKLANRFSRERTDGVHITIDRLESELTTLRARVAELTELLATTIYDRNKAEAKAKELKRNLSDAQKTILAFERGAQP